MIRDASNRDRGHPPIADYGIIGNCRTAALISREGSVDWLCLPRFDSPAMFAALLDRERGGRFVVQPTTGFEVQRRYAGRTMVLETTFTTERGILRLIDLMPVSSEEEKRRRLTPAHHLLRILACVEGEVEVEIVCDPRPEYGRVVPRLTRHGALGFFYQDGRDLLVLRSEVPLEPRSGAPGLHGRATLRAGERRRISLSFADAEPAVIPPLGEEAEAALHTTLRWWEAWSSRCRYDGPYAEEVVRSALTLKTMTYAPSGAVVAAPTTSLPEKIGGVRNWDYRYCWLRDASLTLRALFDLDYHLEAEAFLSWLIHATRLTWPELQVLYDVYGETDLTERELPHLRGYADSRPVRVGNAAKDQLQLDVYGEVVDAALRFVSRGGRLDRASARMLVGLGETVCRLWREPDDGIWEARSGRRHHTLSKVMCWVALDRLLTLHADREIEVPVTKFEAERAALREAIETRGYSDRLGSYVSVFDTEEIDASLLLLALHGYAPADAPRMRRTWERIREQLGVNGLLYRYRTFDGLPPGEGAFGICCFWAVEALARAGEVELAEREFRHLLGYANDLGLFAEEMDPETGAALGNFPQAFTHVGLINAAIKIEEYRGRRSAPPEETKERTRAVTIR